MRTLELADYGVSEISNVEMTETEGGFLPLVAVYACWGVMAGCSAVALGMRQALKDHNAKK